MILYWWAFSVGVGVGLGVAVYLLLLPETPDTDERAAVREAERVEHEYAAQPHWRRSGP